MASVFNKNTQLAFLVDVSKAIENKDWRIEKLSCQLEMTSVPSQFAYKYLIDILEEDEAY